MRGLSSAFAVLLAVRAAAGPVGAHHTAAATGYPGAFLASVNMSMAANSFYSSEMLHALDGHLHTLAAMTSPQAVKDYLEMSAVGESGSMRGLKKMLGQEPISAHRASALMLGHALARPDQFPEVLEGLDRSKVGLSKRVTQLLSQVEGRGDPRLIRLLRSRAVGVMTTAESYDAQLQNLGAMFDGIEKDEITLNSSKGVVTVPPGYTGYGPGGRPRRTGLLPPAR